PLPNLGRRRCAPRTHRSATRRPRPHRRPRRRCTLRPLPERLRPDGHPAGRQQPMIDSRILDGEVWFVTGSQSMYGQDTLDQVAGQSRQIAEQLDGCAEIPVRIVWVPTVVTSDNIAAVIRQANDSAQCIGVIAWMHTFSPAKMWIRGLRALQKPLLHLHTQFGVELPWDSIDMDFMNLNQAAHGDREFGYIQSRLSTARKTVAGPVSDQRTRSRMRGWGRAALAAAELSTLRVARFGDN